MTMKTITPRTDKSELIEIISSGEITLAHDNAGHFYRVTPLKRFLLTLIQAFDLFAKLMMNDGDLAELAIVGGGFIGTIGGEKAFFAAVHAALAGHAPACTCQSFSV